MPLTDFIASRAPVMNEEMMKGITYVRINDAIDYIDNFIKYNCQAKTDTNLRYLGYEELSPKEELKFIFNKKSRVTHDIAENDIYLVKFVFQYGEEEQPREYFMYLPYFRKGNVIKLSGNTFLGMPTLADKVISVGERVIFINILTAKYNFNRNQYPIIADGQIILTPTILSELYKNQVKKFDDTTKANSTVMHYLLANYGYSKTMELLLGFVPKPVYDAEDTKGKVILETTGAPPRGWLGDKDLYKKTNIKFVVDEDLDSNHSRYCIGNVFYILDHFPERISIDLMDDPRVWRRLMGEIIHSGNHGLAYIDEKMYAHFNDLNSEFDSITIRKLKDVDVDATNLIQLLRVIFTNYNDWILNADSRSLYGNKSYEVESFVLGNITSRITRTLLDINKEELRINNAPLDKTTVDKIFRKYFATRAIFSLRKERMFITSIDYSGDHLYFKNTAMVVQQESDAVSKNRPESNTSERGDFVASMATIGSILGLSKRNPTPLIRLNPYVRTCPNTGTVLPHPEYDSIVKETDILLANAEFNEDIEGIDDIISDLSSELEDYDDDFELDEDLDDEDYDRWEED